MWQIIKSFTNQSETDVIATGFFLYVIASAAVLLFLEDTHKTFQKTLAT